MISERRPLDDSMAPTARLGSGRPEGEMVSEEKRTPVRERRRGFVSGLSPFRQRIITLNIEGISLRVLSFSGGRVESWVSVPFNPRFVRSGFVAEPDGLGQVIKGVLEEKRIGRGRVVCALTGLGSVSRVLTLPKVSKGDLGEVVTREARRVMGISPETSQVFWQPLPGGEARQRVYVLAVPKEPVVSLVEAVRASGRRPWLVDLKPLALARAVNRRDAIIANGDGNSVEIVIIVDDVPTLMRCVFLGGEMLDSERATINLIEELTRSIAFYNDTNRANPLPSDLPIYLTGEAAESPHLASTVASLTGRPVGSLMPPLPCPPELPLAEYMVNIGLVLRAL